MQATPLPVQAATNPITFTQQAGSDNPFDALALWSYSTPVFVDLNGDGDQDMLSGESAGAFLYFENTSPISQWGDGVTLSLSTVFIEPGEAARTDGEKVELTVTNNSGKPIGGMQLAIDLDITGDDIVTFDQEDGSDTNLNPDLFEVDTALLPGGSSGFEARSTVDAGVLKIVVFTSSGATIPVVLDGRGVAGLQATFTFDPSLMSVGTPVLANAADGLMLDSRIENGTLRLITLSLNGQTLSAGQAVLIPVTLTGAGQASLAMTDLIASSALAQTIPVQLGTVVQPVSGKGTSAPTSFSLNAASPNPFNPATTISYEVPQSAHIQLTVYNLLGQEVVRLVDQTQQPGRYQITWNALNAQGASVASGVYLYRLTSSTGYSR
jgi:hypothetical protein